MASMGSFPAAGVDSSMLLHTGTYHKPMITLVPNRRKKTVLEFGPSADCGSASVGFSRNSTEDRLSIGYSSSGCGRRNEKWRKKLVRATEEKGTEGVESGDGSDEALQATIEKSKKVLAMQRDLLQQIAERKKLVSSIKNSIIDTESSEQPSVQSNNGNLGAAGPEETAELGKNLSGNGKSVDENPREQFKSTKVGKDVPSDGIPVDASPRAQPKASTSGSVQSKELPPIPWESAVIPDAELSPRKESKNTSSGSRTSTEVDSTKTIKDSTSKTDSSKYVRDTTVKTAIWSETPQRTEDAKPKDSKESGADDRSAEAVNPTDEDVKPPPLAGANVMNVILVAAECAPWSKTGGLGDVAGALPKALARRGHRVMVIAPRYGNYAEAQDSGIRRRYKVAGQDHEVNYFQAYIDGVDFVFIDSPMFRHVENNIYGGNREDILKRMALFCKAAIEVPWYVPCGGVCYGDGNLAFIANDWHTALLPVYLKAYYRDNGLMKYTRSVLVIHNIAHQGRGPVEDFSYVDLPPQYIDLFKMYDPVGGEHFNIFAAGLKTADRVVTVSHGYAWELKTSEGGWGLHGIINENDWKLRGIVNGIDTKDWSPEVDVHLQSDGYVNYSIETLKTGKAQCKEALQKELGLPIRPDVPLIGFIGRLDHQKGVDLIAEAIPWMVGQDVQLVMLGTGRTDLEQMLRKFEGQYNDKVRGWVGFSVKTAHRITAGADILLMPSRFEPCGLNQLYAMRYGTIPVVHAVGGLRDTVQQFNPFEESGLGWTFSRAEANQLIHALGNCLLTYREYKQSWEGLQLRGMTQDLSWDKAAQNYEEVLVAAKYQW